MAGALVARYPEMRDVGFRRREPGIVHRLDFGTSGVMLAARTQASFDQLRVELRAGRLEKRYLARCSGVVPAPSCIETPIAHDPSNRRRARACGDPREAKRLGARPGRTEVLTSTLRPQGSLVEVQANRGLRHQIRVHLASVGYPLLGDPLYGGPRLRGIDHHLLHATSIVVGTRRICAKAWAHADRAFEIAQPDG